MARENENAPNVPVLSGQLASPSRRGFLGGLLTVIAAPAIIKVSSLMPVRALPADLLSLDEYAERVLAPLIAQMQETVASNIMRQNNLLTMNMITREAIKTFRNSIRFIEHVNSQYDEKFGYTPVKIGSQLRIKVPRRLVPPLQKHGWD